MYFTNRTTMLYQNQGDAINILSNLAFLDHKCYFHPFGICYTHVMFGLTWDKVQLLLIHLLHISVAKTTVEHLHPAWAQGHLRIAICG